MEKCRPSSSPNSSPFSSLPCLTLQTRSRVWKLLAVPCPVSMVSSFLPPPHSLLGVVMYRGADVVAQPSNGNVAHLFYSSMVNLVLGSDERPVGRAEGGGHDDLTGLLQQQQSGARGALAIWSLPPSTHLGGRIWGSCAT